MGRSRLAIVVVLLVAGVAGCSEEEGTAGGPDDGRFAVVAGEGFHADGSFDARMTCDGAGDYSPPLVFRHAPGGTVELVLSMVDLDKKSPSGDALIHWVEWAIPADSGGLAEHTKPEEAREALSDLGEATYNGPCPPAGQTHHYQFTLLALSRRIDLPYGSPARTVLAAAESRVIGRATLTATYHRGAAGS